MDFNSKIMIDQILINFWIPKKIVVSVDLSHLLTFIEYKILSDESYNILI